MNTSFSKSVCAVLALSLACLTPVVSCGVEKEKSQKLEAISENLSLGEVDVRLTAEPATVQMDRDFIVNIRVSTPAHLKATLPDLRDRFRGFKIAECFSTDPIIKEGVKTFELRCRLIPDLMRTYRLAPFAVTVADTRVQPNTVISFATHTVIFPSEPPPAVVSGAPEVSVKPFWIPPTPRTVLGWAAGLILLAVLVAAIVLGARQVQIKARELRMSPRERAFAELGRLLHRDLVGKRLYKDFYIELTMVVRRYIERAHLIHAPEQTTQEFLAAAAKHPRFTPEVLVLLKTFLESSDLVKFAGQDATPQLADSAVGTARNYISTDAEKVEIQNQVSSSPNQEPRTKN
jgi:hypothetical protein